ncbi:Trafficking protein particle complex subunit 6B [Penicillium verhagenii]|uniref:Trafficking protein particle complex subunit 6B n=1 Tax=Penicillium verhagenii TaxID=1562060 RepID=UPI0025455D54|nr:Trafficking protein particle complex subunit 6B [Penicillium verhagenii]KAJ5921561.1 Trafficking protein particle complex subunit 6B [Penicillium verhagenii]
MSFDATASLSISDPNVNALSSSCFDFLLIELVPMAERLAKELSTKENEPEDEEGVYVLTDSAFRPFARMSLNVRGEAISMAQAYLWFPCGIIRGALANLGINTTVQAETSDLPGATFQIKTVQARP